MEYCENTLTADGEEMAAARASKLRVATGPAKSGEVCDNFQVSFKRQGWLV